VLGAVSTSDVDTGAGDPSPVSRLSCTFYASPSAPRMCLSWSI
jgi:hypothetical protein